MQKAFFLLCIVLSDFLPFYSLCKIENFLFHHYKDGTTNESEIGNNSFVYFEDFINTQTRIASNCPNNIEWLFPDGNEVPASSHGMFVISGELRSSSSECISSHKKGIYTCKKGHDELFVGIYCRKTTLMALSSNITMNITINDYFLLQVSIGLSCYSLHYPPTMITWLLNGKQLQTPYTSVLIDPDTSTYHSHIKLLNYSTISGEYSCEVNAISLSDQRQSNSTMFVSDAPVVSELRLLTESSMEIKWKHSSEITYQYMIAYKDNNLTDVQYVPCGNQTDCKITDLEIDHTYSFVIAPLEGSHPFFEPSVPVEFYFSEPHVSNITIHLNANNLDENEATISWSPFFTETDILIVYFAMCQNTVCVNETKHVAGNAENSVTLSNLIPGMDHHLLIWGRNVIGDGLPTKRTIRVEEIAPISAPLMLSVVNKTSTSISVSWSPLSCCNSSGEVPLYVLSISTNDKEVYNDTTEDYTYYYLFEDLLPRTEYRISVSAVNSAGLGPWSEIKVQTNESSDSSTMTTIRTDPGDSESLLVLVAASGASVAVVALVLIVCFIVIAFVVRLRKPKDPEYRDFQNQGQPNGHMELEIINNEYVRINPLVEKFQAPYLIEFPTDTKAITGETIHFLVCVGGNPKPSISWEYKGEPITPTNIINIFSDGTLILNGVKPQNSGQYTFIASNNAGSINRVINLLVVDEEEEESEENLKACECRSLITDHKPIPVNILEIYVETHHVSDNEPFQFLFTSLKLFPESYSSNRATENREKNRYKNIVPYDGNTVELQPISGWKDVDHTYINASYIDGYNTQNKFIATQGPIKETVADFWRMVWQKQCHVIVMLSNLVEGNKVKCEEYWPKSVKQPSEYGPYIVQILSEELFSNFVIRNMEIVMSDGSQTSLYTKQFHFTAWPDHGVPDHGSPLIVFHQKVMKYHQNSSGPIIVHCSAGVGRTGTFIGLDVALDQIKAEGAVDVIGIINNLREQRMKMVQTCHQLIFLHDTILEFILCGSTLIPVIKISETLDSLYAPNPLTGKTGFTTQFQLIQRLTPKYTDKKCSVGRQYLDKNRPNNPLPIDSRRVVLYGDSPDYINASFVDGYQQKKAFIIAQSPLQHTVTDFWRMITQQKCSVILMLCELAENSKVVCHRYWPLDSGESEVYGHFSIKLIKEHKISESLLRRTIGVKDMNTGKSQTVMQIQMSHWLPNGQCANHQAVGELYTQLTDAQRMTGTAANSVVVHCSDSITRSGMYCVTHNIIEQARLEQMVDVFQAVKSVRMQRPGCVPTEDCYITIYDLVRVYLSCFDLYQMQTE